MPFEKEGIIQSLDRIGKNVVRHATRGVIPYKKDGGVLIGNLKRTPKGYQGPVLWAWLEIFFTSMRFQF